MKDKFISSFTSISWYRVFFLLFFVALTFGQLQRFQLTQSVALYGHEIILLMWALLYRKEIIEFTRVHLFTKPAVMYLLAFVILQTTVLNIFSFELTPLLYLLRLCLYLSLFPLISLGIRRKIINLTHLYFTILGIGTGVAVLGLTQYFFLPDTRFLVYSGWDDHYYRLISTLFDPNFSALIIGLSLLTFLNVRNKILAFNPFIQYSTIGMFILSLLLTYSRAGYLSFAIGVIVVSILTKKIFPIGIIVLMLICIPFLPRPDGEGVKLERTASVISRIESNQSALMEISGWEIVFGRGLYRTKDNSDGLYPNHATAPDNSFIFLFTSLGIIGSGLLVIAMKKSVLTIKSPLTWGTFAIIATHSLFNNSLFYIWTIVLMIVLFHAEQVSSTQTKFEK